MKKITKNILGITLLTFGSTTLATAQVSAQKIGTNPTDKAPSAVLEVEHATKGVLLSRVALTSTLVAAPINNPANALTVFNTATAGTTPNNVTPGYYYWDAMALRWVRILDEYSQTEPWHLENTITKATSNTQNIYQNGNVGIGDFSTSNPIVALDVREGSLRVGKPHNDEINDGSLIGKYSITYGEDNKASGQNAFAGGYISVASGERSVALGMNAQATAGHSVALGLSTVANGERAFATGFGTEASGESSTAFGAATKATGVYATAFGHLTNATARWSTAFGVNATAIGVESTAMGANTIAPSHGEFVAGRSNAITTGNVSGIYPTDALFQLGNGDSGRESNAITVLKNAHTAIGVSGTEATAKPTELLDLGGEASVGNGGLKIRNINSVPYKGDMETDRIVVADPTGVLKTVSLAAVIGDPVEPDPIYAPWRVQNTTNRAISNLENIYQRGKVAVGNFSGSISDKQFEVKGSFKAEVVRADNTFIGTEIAHPSFPNHAIHYWLDGATGNYKAASASDFSAALEAKHGNTTNTISATDGQTTMVSINGTNSMSTIRNTNTGNFYMETYNVANNNGSTLAVGDNGVSLVHANTNGATDPFPNNHRTELLVQKTTGIGIDLRDAAGVVKANYFLPTTSGTAGQVLTKSTGNNTVWAAPVATPKFFYSPSLVLPTTTTGLPSYVTYAGGTFTVDLHAYYQSQFNMSGATGPIASRSAIKSTGAGTLPVIANTALEYFVTYFDNTVFDPATITLSNTGVLTYQVLPGTVTEKTYMNIVFKVK